MRNSGALRWLFAGILLATASIGRSDEPSAAPADAASIPAFFKDARILFQGDSITDMNRGRTADPNHILGHSYVFIIAAKYGATYPELNLTFINRGISGNKVSDLTRRWTKDTLDLKPDVLSILIGVNDLNGGVTADDYEKQYDDLLAQTVKELPNVRLVLCEPFGLPTGKKKDGWDAYHKQMIERQAIVARLAEKYHSPCVHFQKVFDDAAKKAPPDYWIWDGVHPTYRGHQLMADEWTSTVREFWKDAPSAAPTTEK